jgi:hypothetical protein
MKLLAAVADDDFGYGRISKRRYGRELGGDVFVVRRRSQMNVGSRTLQARKHAYQRIDTRIVAGDLNRPVIVAELEGKHWTSG